VVASPSQGNSQNDIVSLEELVLYLLSICLPSSSNCSLSVLIGILRLCIGAGTDAIAPRASITWLASLGYRCGSLLFWLDSRFFLLGFA
jgi:hypothetical protein